MKLVLALAAVLYSADAMAQQQQSAAEQALIAKISSEINAGLQCSTGLITAQAKIKELEEKVRTLEAKPPDK